LGGALLCCGSFVYFYICLNDHDRTWLKAGDWWVFDSGLRTEQIEEKEAI